MLEERLTFAFEVLDAGDARCSSVGERAAFLAETSRSVPATDCIAAVDNLHRGNPLAQAFWLHHLRRPFRMETGTDG